MSAAASPFADPFDNVIAFPGSKLEHALQLARMGFYVIPLPANQKSPPAIEGWQTWATRDEDKIRGAWKTHPNRNIGISTSRYGDDRALLVLDVDVRDGKPGEASLATLQAECGAIPETLTVRTPTGGTHYFLVVDRAVKQGVNTLGAGLDTRSQGGYVVAAGSTTKDGTYTFLDADVPIASAPQWLIAKCGQPRVKDENASKPLEGVDPDAARERAIGYAKTADPAIEGLGGDGCTYRTVCHVKDMGVTEPVCLDVLLEYWNPRCEPPWQPDDLAAKVRNGYRYGDQRPGVAAPEVAFDAVPADEQKPAPAAATKRHLHFELFADVEPQLARPELVEGLLEHGAMSVLYGESNTGKTFVALDIAFHVAAGRPWMGRHTETGLCVYIAAEGGSGARKRVKALRTHYGVTKGVPLALVPCSVDLSGKGADVQPVLDLIMDAQKACGQPVVLVVVDTLSRAMAGGNENASEDMTAFVSNVDRIRTATKAHALVIHHSGKNKAAGARGHSSLRAATDTEIEVADRTITATKQRDIDPCAPIGFDLQPVTIGTDARGKAVTSCVLVERNASAQQAFERGHIRAGSVAAQALTALENLTMNGGSVPVAAWREEFHRVYDGDREAARKAFQRAMKTLREAHRVRVENDHAAVK